MLQARFLAIGALSLSMLAGAALFSAPLAAREAALLASQLNNDFAVGYRVGAGDKIKVTVFDEPSLTGEYQIGGAGELAMPLIDPIATNGLTPKEIAATIAAKLKAGGYVLVPRVAAEVVINRPFYILGEVKQPGEYPYSGDMTFEQSVARAGGFTPRANRSTILLRRQNWASAKKVRLDGPALKIAPGDTITVRESFF
ncbi:polysaccharide biosynthesis/export family protein [Novosphingobium aquiterrae]|uniref:Polysaccharide biosynthesis/export family protein n=1 Tax=Novosphingobium aquiterrae TaxID=624388 RepID=A0ABV6PEG0_9SPHN